MESWLSRITDYLIAQSWQIAVLIVVVAIVSFLLRNKSAHVRYLIWLVVLAKCLVPPLHSVPFAILPQEQPIAFVESSPMAGRTFDASRIERDVVTEPVKSTSVQAPMEPPPKTIEGTSTYNIRVWLAIGWLVGAVALLFYNLLNALRTQIWLQRQRKELPVKFRHNVESFFSTHGMKHIPNVWLINGMNQPFVWGLVRGSIYLPADLLNFQDSKSWASLLGHELSHVIRFDAIVHTLQIFAQVVFWFHPFVWWANRKIRAEREKCCDEMTIVSLHTLPEDYSEAIVEALAVKYESIRPAPSLAVAGPVRNIEERIKTMLIPGKKFYKRPSLVAITVVLFIAFLTIPTTLVLTARGGLQLPAQSVASEKPEQPRFAARTFNSEIAFSVWLQETSTTGEWQIGRTPSATPLEIPACWLWGVGPSAPVNDWDLLIREISQNEIPSLYLAGRNVVDSDLKQLAGLAKLRSLSLSRTSITDAGLGHLKGMTGLQTLKLYAPSITDAGLEHLKGLTGLKELVLEASITDAGLEHLNGLTGLQNLDLGYTSITDAGLEHLKGLTGLQTLDLTRTSITDVGLQHLKGMTGLQELRMSSDAKITDAGLEHLKGMTGLKRLDLGGTSVTDAGLEYLKGMTGLQRLWLSGTSITDVGLEHLKDMTGLQTFYLDNTSITDAGLEHLKGLNGLQKLRMSGDAKITDAGLEHLKGLTGLQTLYLEGTSVTDAGLEHLKGLTGFQALYLGGPSITDVGLEHLKDMTSLQILGLMRTKITDAGLEHLKGLAGLQTLYLTRTSITDAGLEHIKGLTGLQRLDLMSTSITDAGLEHLKGMTDLQYLNLMNTKVTDAGVQQLQQSLPNLWQTRQTRRGAPTLFRAVISRDIELVKLLISQGADVNEKNPSGGAPLYVACRIGNKEIAELLIDNGADVNAKNLTGQTPLHLVCQRGNKEIAEFLIDKGADINSRLKNGRAPLHLAVISGQKDIVELLIAKGADVDAKTGKGDTPISLARENQHREVVELLRKHGAK